MVKMANFIVYIRPLPLLPHPLTHAHTQDVGPGCEKKAVFSSTFATAPN